MNAPVDIMISIIDRMKREYETELKEFKGDNLTFFLTKGKIQAMEELKDKLEGFKRLFS